MSPTGNMHGAGDDSDFGEVLVDVDSEQRARRGGRGKQAEAQRQENPQPALEFEREWLLPEAVTVTGVQHLVSNLSADTHRSMDQWDTIYQQCQNIQAFLTMKERRDRFWWTCAKGTVDESEAKSMFAEWGQSLYTKRWGAVTSWLARVQPRLRLLRRLWDPERFTRGVDASGGAFKDDSSQGGPAFDMQMFTRSLRDPFFLRYTKMLLLVDAAPDQLSKWSAGCVCHDAFLQRLSPHRAAQMMQAHFGEGRYSCPCAGMRAPELAAGCWETVLEPTWTTRRQQVVRDWDDEDGALGVLTQPQMETLLADFDKARAVLELNLRQAFDYFTRLPMKLAAMAHHDEAIARRVAQECLADFGRDPRQNVHHRKTWQILGPESPIAIEVQRFADGTPRAELSQDAQHAICLFRFILVAEIFIVQKHAPVSLAEASHKMGPVMVSLCNRMPWLEKQLTVAPLFLQELCESFSVVRKQKRVPFLFGFERHPAVQPKKRGRDSTAVLTEIVYRCDMEAAFATKDAAAKHHSNAKKRERNEWTKALGNATKRLTEDSIVRHAILPRVREIATQDHNVVYSVPRHMLLSVCEVRMFHSQHISKMRRSDDDLQEHFGAAVVDVDDAQDAPDSPDHSDLFFSIIKATPSSKKVVGVAPGAGNRMSTTDIAICMYPVLRQNADECVISSRPNVEGTSHWSVGVLSQLAEGPALAEHSSSWQRGRLEWVIPGAWLDDDVNKYVTKLVMSGAFHGLQVVERRTVVVAGSVSSLVAGLIPRPLGPRLFVRPPFLVPRVQCTVVGGRRVGLRQSCLARVSTFGPIW